MSSFIEAIFTDEDVLLSHTLGPSTAVSVQVHHTTPTQDGLQWDDLIQRYSEHLVWKELASGFMESLMGTEVVMAKCKLLATVIKRSM
jgi:hypothetical protein